MSTSPEGELQALAEALLASVGWDGLFMLEFIRDSEGRPWFVELNGRPWGSTALARRSGFEYPAWSVLQALGRRDLVQAPDPVPGIRCRHVGRDLVHLLFVLRGGRPKGPGWPSRGAAIREVLGVRRGDHYYNWRRGHFDLFLDDVIRTIAATVGRRTA